MTYAYSTAARTVRMSITVQVPVEMYDRFEREKEQQKRSMSAIANDIFEGYFKEIDELERQIEEESETAADINTHGGDGYGSL